VTFTDAENDRSTLKLTGTQLSWHDSETDECLLRPITRLTYRAADATLAAPERADLLVSRLMAPAEGQQRDQLLAEIVRMANVAGVELEGFPEIAVFICAACTLANAPGVASCVACGAARP
jgi:hypothetical protein